MKINVCHFTVAHQVTDTRIFEKECKSLVKNGYNVSFIVPNEKDRVLDGIHILGVPMNTNPIIRIFSGVRKVYKKALELDSDIYHFHDIELFWVGLKLKKKGKIVIFDSHEDWVSYIKEIQWMPKVLRNLTSKYLTRSYKLNLDKFDKIITVSPHIVDNLKNYTQNGKVEMITNYPIIKKEGYDFISLDDYSRRGNKLCYAGTVYDNSNQDSILKAIENVEDITYVIVGVLKDSYKAFLSDIKGWNKVEFIDQVSKKELDVIYNSVTYGIVLFDYSLNCGGRKGTMGNNKIFEYMLAGLPVLCTDFDCWKDLIVDKYNCGICIPPNNVENIQEAICYLINNKEEAYKMGLNGRNAVMNEFNWSTQEEKLVKIYKNL